MAVGHRTFLPGGWPIVTRLLRGGSGVMLDVKGALDRAAIPARGGFVVDVTAIPSSEFVNSATKWLEGRNHLKVTVAADLEGVGL